MGPEYADRTPYGYMANGDRRRFKQHWDKVLRDKPDKPLAFMSMLDLGESERNEG